MMTPVNYITQIEIDSLWDNNKHIVWDLNERVNILSGINGVGKTTILNKLIKCILNFNKTGSLQHQGVSLKVVPNDANTIRFGVIRSFDKPLPHADELLRNTGLWVSELDKQLYELQRQYLNYQVNIGNKMIEVLQSGSATATEEAQQLAQPKTLFQNIIDKLFADTGKTIIRTANEVLFKMGNRQLDVHCLSSGEKQILIILLTVLVENNKSFILLMDEPEASLHVDWQQQLIQLILQLNPNVQIILSTHSPAVIMNGWIDCVTEVNDIVK